uniref:Uncharacterized protein n=1 Tax=Candidatus Kentrum sp. DK TaxID=2126562 RepID=A0A450S0Q8_9GAMM|nr:MAG: hypothetical protein BECKDK2373B_GA0170837_100932 [Candidatus Kentron sp. DK]
MFVFQKPKNILLYRAELSFRSGTIYVSGKQIWLLLDSRLIFYDRDYGGFCRFFAPKGLCNIAQGCREATTLGKRNPTQHNPNGVA